MKLLLSDLLSRKKSNQLPNGKGDIPEVVEGEKTLFTAEIDEILLEIHNPYHTWTSLESLGHKYDTVSALTKELCGRDKELCEILLKDITRTLIEESDNLVKNYCVQDQRYRASEEDIPKLEYLSDKLTSFLEESYSDELKKKVFSVAEEILNITGKVEREFEI
jgi:hypothetical protein